MRRPSPMQTHYDAPAFAALLERFADLTAGLIPLDRPFNVVGIRTRGDALAKRLLPLLHRRGAGEIGHGALDITLYRDDLSEIGPRPIVRPTELNFEIDKRPLVLVDDVLYTGRTVRAALNALADFGRPSVVRLAVLVERPGRELPISPDGVALRVTTPLVRQVKVKVAEHDGEDGIEILRHA